MTLQTYLGQKLSPKTVKLYCRDIKIYLNQVDDKQAQRATWSNIMEYVEYLRTRYHNAYTITRILYAIKAYYNWLIETGTREDHPCRGIKLMDAKGKPLQLQDLFKTEELEKLLDREERFNTVSLKNQVITSLLIYQGITSDEIIRLKTRDINLEKGNINIRPTRKLNGRTLQLKSTQIMLFYKYLNELRPKLAKDSTNEAFLLNLRGSPITSEDVQYLIETMQNRFPGRKLNPQTIRMSVIRNMLKAGGDLRVVQVFAGHKKISSTERYQPSASEALITAVNKYHPLG
jgi:integrase/recombinase XerD